MKAEQQAPGRAGGFFVTIATAAGSTTKKVDGDLLTVGRAEDCHLTISHETLSRRHLSLSIRDGATYVEDHGSSNGTLVNGKRIKPHTPTRLLPEDQITMGQAGVRLSASIEPVMRKEGSPPLPSRPDEPAPDTIVTSTAHHRREQRKLVALPSSAVPKDEAQEQAEAIVQAAQKKAALMIQEAEIEAEKRVEDIYRRAHETQAKMDDVYQRRMNEAYRSSEQIYQKAQEESQKILDVARQRSNEIRSQAENFVGELRKRTEDDCERMLEEAQQTARDLKEQRLLEAQDQIEKREAEFTEKTRAAMNERMARFEEELSKEAARQRGEVDAELEEKRSQFELEYKDQITHVGSLKEESTQLRELKQREESLLAEIETTLKLKSEESRSLKEEVDAAKRTVAKLKSEMDETREETLRLHKERDASEKSARTAVETLAKYNDEIRVSQAKVKAAQDEAEGQLVKIRAKLEDDKAKLQKEESEHFEELKLQTARKIRDLEMRMVDELHDKKDLMSRELMLTIETFIKRNPDSKNMRMLQDEISALLDKQIVTITQDDSAKVKQASLVQMKRRQKLVTTFWGLVFGAAGALGGERAYFVLKNEQSPMQRHVDRVAEERAKDLEERKFAPPQTPGFKATYVDNVVYTENFVETYNSDEFQNRLRKGLSAYMLRMWKTDEDKIIELLGIANALVKNLGEKRANIHPDFVNQGLEKMKADENEAVGRMRTLLGSQVRVESFKKYEKQFYDDYRPGAAN